MAKTIALVGQFLGRFRPYQVSMVYREVMGVRTKAGHNMQPWFKFEAGLR